MNKLSYGTDTNVYSAADIRGLTTTAMREKLKKDGIDFSVWKDEIVVKLSKDDTISTVKESLEKVAALNGYTDPVIHMSYFSAFHIEFTLSPQNEIREINLVDNLDVIRVDITLNYSDDHDYCPGGEPSRGESITQEVLISHTTAYGQAKVVQEFAKEFRKNIRSKQEVEKSSLVNWVFSGNDGARESTFQIKKTWDISREFYPWIETDLVKYYQSFVASRAQILVLYGPPGTGKTSFIRDMLCEMNLNAYISYDLKILTSDSTFVSYVNGSVFDAIVIEDADELLTSSRGEQNKVIAKILNVSDGLIKLPRKKLIFSTNLENVSDIDTAIIRPGRCFDVMEFRELDRKEADAAAAALGVTITEDKKKYSLAEIFYQKDLQDCTDPFARKHGEVLKKTIGFI